MDMNAFNEKWEKMNEEERKKLFKEAVAFLEENGYKVIESEKKIINPKNDEVVEHQNDA